MSLMSPPELKGVLRRQLDDTWAGIAEENAERAVIQIAVRKIKVDVIQRIEELKAQLEAVPLRDIKLTTQRDVDIEIPGPHQRIRPRVAKCADSIRGERRWVKPLTGARVLDIRAAGPHVRAVTANSREGIIRARSR